MKNRKLLTIVGMLLISVFMLTACGNGDNGGNENNGGSETSSFDLDREIAVISREDGSGTRGAFIEIMGIEQKGDDGSKKDLTTKEAIIANKTDVMLTTVAGNPYAIGYASLGSISSTVKLLKVDGVEATSANVQSGEYKVARPFNIAYKEDISDLAKDFIDFILSKEGQVVVAESYVPINDNAESYSGSMPSGKITVAGSSSVTPVMEKLKEAYAEINTEASIEIQMSDSTAGMTGAIDGTFDIGMASRNLKDSEKAVLDSVEIAIDGIGIIVNNENFVNDISSDDLKAVFMGEKIEWSEVGK